MALSTARVKLIAIVRKKKGKDSHELISYYTTTCSRFSLFFCICHFLIIIYHEATFRLKHCRQQVHFGVSPRWPFYFKIQTKTTVPHSILGIARASRMTSARPHSSMTFILKRSYHKKVQTTAVLGIQCVRTVLTLQQHRLLVWTCGLPPLPKFMGGRAVSCCMSPLSSKLAGQPPPSSGSRIHPAFEVLFLGLVRLRTCLFTRCTVHLFFPLSLVIRALSAGRKKASQKKGDGQKEVSEVRPHEAHEAKKGVGFESRPRLIIISWTRGSVASPGKFVQTPTGSC